MNHLRVFEKMGIEPLGNRRQAWDGVRENGHRFLVIWTDQQMKDGRYRALDRIEHGRQRGTGPVHRLTSLQLHMTYDTPMFAFLAEAMDPKAEPRTVRVCSDFLFRVTEVTRDAKHWYVRIEPMSEMKDCFISDGPGVPLSNPIFADDMTQCSDQLTEEEAARFRK